MFGKKVTHMLRTFIQQHPTFGSYKKPDAIKVEASMYYWWWLALTLNDEYAELCDRLQNGSVTAANEREQQMLAVYKDFGDVRYEGSSHKAFADWWNAEVGRYKNGRKIQKGADLFAEPQDNNVHYINDTEHAVKCVEDEAFLVVAIPKINDKTQVEQTLALMLNKHFVKRQNRDARNPKYSRAKYPPSKAAQPDALKKVFNIYLLKREMESTEKRIANADLAELAGVTFKARGSKEDKLTKLGAFEKRHSDSQQVTRFLRNARQMIDNAAIGIFP